MAHFMEDDIIQDIGWSHYAFLIEYKSILTSTATPAPLLFFLIYFYSFTSNIYYLGMCVMIYLIL